MGMFEIAVIVGLALTLIVKAGHHNTADVFSPHTGNPHGLSAVFTAMVYTILAFIGFWRAPTGQATAEAACCSRPAASGTSFQLR
jgi:amino acid transporter